MFQFFFITWEWSKTDNKLKTKKGEGGFWEEVKEDDIYQKFGHLNNSDTFFFGPTDRQKDRQIDRQTNIVVYREVTLPKNVGHDGFVYAIL